MGSPIWGINPIDPCSEENYGQIPNDPWCGSGDPPTTIISTASTTIITTAFTTETVTPSSFGDFLTILGAFIGITLVIILVERRKRN